MITALRKRARRYFGECYLIAFTRQTIGDEPRLINLSNYSVLCPGYYCDGEMMTKFRF